MIKIFSIFPFMEYKDLDNKVAIVTGGGTGIGLAISRKFCSLNINTVITGRREEVLKEACDSLGARASYLVNDISNLEKIPGLVKDVDARFGGIDILVNNAGIHIKKEALDLNDEEYGDVIRINQAAVFSLSRETARIMKKRGAGSIILISSMASQYGIPKAIAYTAAKSAVEGMTRALAVEWSPLGIRINCIAPGFIKTAMSAKALDNDPERKKRVLSRTPLGRLGKPVDIANAAAFLVSEDAGFITGVVLPVDGGNSVGF